jgi:hypothetical protein
MQQQGGECSLPSQFPRTERQQGFGLKEHSMATETDLWRAAVVDAVTEATGQLVSANPLTYAERDKKRWAMSAAEREGDDAWLMRYLKHYCPNDPHAYSYPGLDH